MKLVRSRATLFYVVVGMMLLLIPASSLRAFANGPLVPSTQVTVTLSNWWHNSYVDATFANVPAGYVLQNGVGYLAWCIDLDHTVRLNQPYSARLYIIDNPTWRKANWVINNKGAHTKYFIQAALWRIFGWGWTKIDAELSRKSVTVDHTAVGTFVGQANENFWPTGCQMIAVEIYIDDCTQLLFFELHIPLDVPEFGDSIPIVTSVAGTLLLLVKDRVKRK